MKIGIQDIVKVSGGIVLNGCSTDECYITHVTANSGEVEKGSLFLAIEGERTDGHKYVKDAFDKGAVAAFVVKDIDFNNIPEDRVCIKVSDTIAAIQKVAAWYRSKFSIPVVAVTGSVGKTTTKEMIAGALGAGKNVLKTEGNMNSQLGVALMMFRLTEDYDIAVIEMGMSEPDEMHRLSEIAKPEVAVVTNIGVSHIGQLGSREHIRMEKLDIVRGFDKPGKLFIPSSDELLNREDAFLQESLTKEAYEKMKNMEIIYFGQDSKCAYKAKDICNEEKGVSFTIEMPGKSERRVNLSVLGLHNVYNALVAVAIADSFGVDAESAIKIINEYKPMAMRGQIINKNGITIIDDTYNASPDSMKSGLSVLRDTKCAGKRWAVLADILELGKESAALHAGIGEYIANNNAKEHIADELVTVGKEAANIANKAKECGVSCNSFENRDDAVSFIKSGMSQGDVIFVKGSRGMKMDKVVEELLND